MAKNHDQDALYKNNDGNHQNLLYSVSLPSPQKRLESAAPTLADARTSARAICLGHVYKWRLNGCHQEGEEKNGKRGGQDARF